MASLNPSFSELRFQLDDLEVWNEKIAAQIAVREGIEMTAAHWEVVHFLRTECERHEGMCNARKMVRGLQQRFQAQGGKRYLYQLFPGGPVRQGSRIAGLPMPAETLDLSFGSVH